MTAAVVLAAFLAATLAPRASALGDPVAPGATSNSTLTLGGGIVKKLRKAKVFVKVIKPAKLKGKRLTLPISEGTSDPTTIDGLSLSHRGGLKLQKGKKKLVIKNLTIAVSGKKGTLKAKIGAKTLKIGTVKAGGASLARTGFDTGITGLTIKLNGTGKAAIKKAFGVKIKGQPTLAQVSSNVSPSSVQLVSGSTTLAPPPATLQKFQQDMISPTPITPATAGVQNGLPFFTFQIASGTVSPTAIVPGRVVHTGGIQLAQPSPPAPGPGPTVVPLTAFVVKLDPAGSSLSATTPIGDATLGDVDLSAATSNIDPATRTFTVNGASVKLNAIAAQVLNATFVTTPAPFVAGDVLGASNLTAVAR